LPSEPGLARHRVMRFAQGLGYDGFTAVPSALREELTQRSKGPLGRVRWDIEHGSNSELLLRRARQVSDLALEHRICVAAVAGAGRVTRIAVQRFQRCGRAFPRSVAPSNSFVMLAPRSFFPPNTRATPSTAPGASRTAFSWSAGRSRSIPSCRRHLILTPWRQVKIDPLGWWLEPGHRTRGSKFGCPRRGQTRAADTSARRVLHLDCIEFAHQVR
jgi:hypothetical protein